MAGFYHQPPDRISDEEIKNHRVHLLRDNHAAVSSLIVAVSGLRFFSHHAVLQRNTTAIEQALPLIKKLFLRRTVHSVQELEQLFYCPELNRYTARCP